MTKNGNGNGPLLPEHVAQALLNSKGFVSAAAKALNSTRAVIDHYIEEYEVVQDALVVAREDVTDMVEAKLLQLIQADNVPAITFYLKCHGKDRGYVDRVDKDGRAAWVEA